MHYEKFAKTAVGMELKHDSRETQNNSNKNIDTNRTPLNYNLCERDGVKPIDYYKARLKQVKCQNRADVKTLCSWIITLPKDRTFTGEEERKFFEAAFNEFNKKYGKENCVSAYVHRDEGGQPHLHYKFIPVVQDKKHPERFKVSAKEATTRADLKTIHKTMQKAISKELGSEVCLINGATAGGNKTVLELENESKQRELDKKDSLLNDTRIAIFNETRAYNEIHGKVLKEEELKAMTVKPGIFNKNYVKVPYPDYQNLLRTAERVKEVDSKEKQLHKWAEGKEQEFNERKERFKEVEDNIKEAAVLYMMEQAKGVAKWQNENESPYDKILGLEQFIASKGLTEEFDKVKKQKYLERAEKFITDRAISGLDGYEER